MKSWPWIAGISLVVAAGCFSPDYHEGVECSAAAACPPGMMCSPADNRCYFAAPLDAAPEPSCTDGEQNGGESAVDCGGSCPALCSDGATCNQGDDCRSGVCTGDICAVPECGDGVVNQPSEVCDEGGATADCTILCYPTDCGDGVVDAAAGEECDDAGESALCNIDCTLAECGDGTLNPSAGEACDDAGESAACDSDCTFAICGDGTVNSAANETCDDGVESASCDADCSAAVCGDGVVNSASGESCDGDGMGTGGQTATCDIDCTDSICGDGVVNVAGGEACDGNGMGAGGETAACDIDCTASACGDGIANGTAGEQCDDGNVTPGDGCNNACLAESGCSGLASFSAQIAPDLWICAFNNMTGKTWPQTYGVCNEATGFYLPTVASMTRRGLPTSAQISTAMSAAVANGHDYITSGHPARSCSWDSALTSYESCNGLGYVHTAEVSNGANWLALTDGNDADYRNWPAANTTGAHPLASLCLNATGDPVAYVFDHRWR